MQKVLLQKKCLQITRVRGQVFKACEAQNKTGNRELPLGEFHTLRQLIPFVQTEILLEFGLLQC